MSQCPKSSTRVRSKPLSCALSAVILITAMSAQAAPTDGVQPVQTPKTKPTLAAQMRPSDDALSEANQTLLTHNAQLQRQVNDLQTQVNVLVYESKGQLFLYGAFTVLISLLVGIFIAWLVFVRRERW